MLFDVAVLIIPSITKFSDLAPLSNSQMENIFHDFEDENY
jgi:hypothetical protein